MVVENPFEQVTLDELRRRTSMKWRAHPADVLPLWVAEMDVPLAEPVVRALADARRRAATPATRRAPSTPRRWRDFAARALGLGRARAWSARRSCPT